MRRRKINFNIWELLTMVVLFLFSFYQNRYLPVYCHVPFLLGNPLIQLLPCSHWKFVFTRCCISTHHHFNHCWYGGFDFFLLVVPPLVSRTRFLSTPIFLMSCTIYWTSILSAIILFIVWRWGRTWKQHTISQQLNTYMNAENISSVLNHTLVILALSARCQVLFIIFFSTDENRKYDYQLHRTRMKDIVTSKKCWVNTLGRFTRYVYCRFAVLIVLILETITRQILCRLLNMVPYYIHRW